MHILAVFERSALGGTQPQGEAVERVTIRPAETLLLDLPSGDGATCWSSEQVQAVETALATRRMRLVGHIRERVLAHAKRAAWAPWLDALFKQHCEMSTELALLDRVLPILRRVDAELHSVWFLDADLLSDADGR
ncbi:MAG: hypothetical protein VX589_14455 [Myxococcota bacterium]|nr:hypothetical protein [Myxococcota bacterium]